MEKRALLRKLPSVDELLKDPLIKEVTEGTPHYYLLKAVREVIDRKRKGVRTGTVREIDREELVSEVINRVRELLTPSLRPLINATGVVIHTNLGRAPLADRVLEHVVSVARGYSNLEFNLNTGKRGKRYDHIRGLLRDITGAEDALVVNNNAAAVLLCLSALARGREVVVSRGELVEIGGSFRVPDVMAQSGALLREVGTTNKTHLRDYEAAIGEDTALLLKVHQSNYRIIGFTEEVSVEELVGLAHRHNLPVMFDLGSGCLMDLRPLGITTEPVVSEVLKKGVDILTFSGDKLLGGPQAGIILGSKEYIESIASHPLTRAVRIDKLTLSALEALIHLYTDMQMARAEIPVLRMLFQDIETIKKRAQRLKRALAKHCPHLEAKVMRDSSQAGGGSLPEVELPTFVVALKGLGQPEKLKEALRFANPPVITRIKDDWVVLDMRTVQDRELPLLINSVRMVIEKGP